MRKRPIFSKQFLNSSVYVNRKPKTIPAMENQNFNEEQDNTEKKLEWGDHNPKLTDENFIDRNAKKVTGTDELLASSEEPIIHKEEPGRDRKGVKEGKGALDLNEKRGKAF
jgi:hypothetical protein